jgi:hypothetical protein
MCESTVCDRLKYTVYTLPPPQPKEQLQAEWQAECFLNISHTDTVKIMGHARLKECRASTPRSRHGVRVPTAANHHPGAVHLGHPIKPPNLDKQTGRS